LIAAGREIALINPALLYNRRDFPPLFIVQFMLKLTAILGGFVVFPVLVLALTAFWIWMLIDCASHETEQGRKIAWLIIIGVTHWIGATVYFFLGRKRLALQRSL
jgi:hypothetical protein